MTLPTDKGKVVYELKAGSQKAEKEIKGTIKDKEKQISKMQLEALDAELKRTGVKMEVVKERYHFEEP